MALNRNYSGTTRVDSLQGQEDIYVLRNNGREWIVQANSQDELNRYVSSVELNQPVPVVTTNPAGNTSQSIFNPEQIVETRRNIDIALDGPRWTQTTGVYYSPLSDRWYQVNAQTNELIPKSRDEIDNILGAQGYDGNTANKIAEGYNNWFNNNLWQSSRTTTNTVVNNPSNLVPPFSAEPPTSTTRAESITLPVADPPTVATTFPVAPQGTVPTNSTPEVSNLFDVPDVPIGAPNATLTPEQTRSLAPVVTAQPVPVGQTQRAPTTIAQGSSPEYDAQIATSTQEIQTTADIAAAQGVFDISAGVYTARNSDTPASTPFVTTQDWRLRISLAPSANYLYRIAQKGELLYPLQATNGVIFPYTPTIDLTYSANYESTTLTHSNYKAYNYTGSSVENIQITGDFTAQDTVEANYLLAVIHFFRSVTKMFYGRDQNPIAGTPPPLCYLTGFGTYAFDNHPVAVQTFSLKYPNDVDYINAGPSTSGGTSALFSNNVNSRLRAARLQPGGLPPPAVFNQGANSKINTRVPTKLNIMITCIPIITRYNMSNTFNLKDYATGKLLKGKENPRGGGIW